VPAIQFVLAENATYKRPHEIYDDETIAVLREDGRLTDDMIAGAGAVMYFPGSDTDMQMFEARYSANTQIPPHAHAMDEIIYVLEGEIRFGATVCRAGSAVMVPGNTLYSFNAGPDGVRFLNFRPSADPVHLTKEQFMASRQARTTAE
jgi:quercetin dioxygenase-like cupin family protein